MATFTLTEQEIKDFWIVSLNMDPNSRSFGAMQSWGVKNPPEGYAFVPRNSSRFGKNGDDDFIMHEYYKEKNADDKPYLSAGHVTWTVEDCQDEEGNYLGKIITDCTFSDELYNEYRLSLPNPVPGIVQGKISEAENKPAELMSEGVTINSLNLSATFLNLDGTESTDEVFHYDQFTQDELLKAYVACHSGMKNYTLKLRNKRAVKLPAEAIYRLYIECETAKRMQEAYSEVYIKFLSTHINDDRSQEEVVEAFTYGETEMPE